VRRLRIAAFVLGAATPAAAQTPVPAGQPRSNADGPRSNGDGARSTVEEPPRAVAGETIVITGLRLPRPVRDVPAAVTVIDRAEIDRSPHRLTDDLLRTLPSVGTFRRSSSLIADPTSQGLNLRGVGPSAVSRALVLRDGVPINDPFGGWVYWRAISPLGIERIEAAPSGASALFGDFALGGVVQMISRPIESRSLAAVLAGGSHRTGRAAVRATDRIGDVGIALEGEAFRSGGYAPIAPEQRGAVDGPASSYHGAAGARVEHSRAGGTAHVSARWFRESLDAGTRLTTADVRTLTLGAGYKLVRDTGTLDVELFGGDHLFEQQRARVAPDRNTATLASRQRTPSANQGALALYTTQRGRHAFVVGADGRRVSGTATDVLSPPTIEADTLVERAAGGEQRFAGIFVEDAIHLTPAIDIAAAIRLDGWQNRAGALALTRGSGEMTETQLPGSSQLQLDPRVGVLGRVTGELALRGSVYRAFRAPTLNELYRPFQVGTVLTAANEALAPETLWGAEAGPQIVVSNIVVRATGFYNRLDDAIGNVTVMEPLPSGATRQRQNFGTARIAGLELDASWRPIATWTVAIAHTFMDAKVVAAPDQPNLVGKRLAHDPHHRATASITFDDEDLVTITAQVRYLGPQFEDDLNTLPIGAVALVDARASRAVGYGFSAFVAAENLFDRRYLVGRAGVDTLGAPRTFELGLMFESR
jgi:iron complex outermembrane recepter protein